MEKVAYQGLTLTRWNVGTSSFLALPERGARLMNWHITLGDGSVRVIPIRDQNDKEMQKTLKALITVGGGEVVEVP